MTKKETHSFDAEVGKILQLMIHSLYENKEIFLRELISNASDACDRLRYQALTTPDLLKEDTELHIDISVDTEKKTLTITDNGIGMSHDELVENLGTIARSGTQNFVEQLTGDKTHDMQLIGQFGVGFYSCYMVAHKVEVLSKTADSKEAYLWESEGSGKFTITPQETDAPRGTSITLYLKDSEEEFLDPFRIKHIITTYSNHVAFSIRFIEEDGKEETVNDAKALWLKSKSEITEEEYNEFYQQIGFMGNDEPWMTLHNNVEGSVNYTNLLFIPSEKPFDLFHPDRTSRVKLYIKRVFITDQNIDIIPTYLRFLRGVVDSEDLPLNISRETLQKNVTLHKIRNAIAKRILSELKKNAEKTPESYASFWENFGAVIKEGLCDATEKRDDILDICRFTSSNSNGKLISLEEYIEAMKPGQNTIYFITGDDKESLLNSPQLEGFRKHGIDVLLLTDSVDDFWVNVVQNYKDTAFASVTRADVNFDELTSTDEKDKEEKEEKAKEKPSDNPAITALTETIKETLGEAISDVRVSNKLTESPVCLAVSEGGMDIRMERFLVENKQLPQAAAKIFEINPDHPIITSLADTLKKQGKNDHVTDMIHLLFAQANIIEGQHIHDVTGFTRRLNSLITKTLAA